MAHTWNEVEPYSVGWWDGHGTPEDLDNPYIYIFSLDQEEKPTLGGLASLKVVFDRSNGDTDNGAFGTYGHKTVTSSDDGQSEVVYDATADWTGYKYFQFDIKNGLFTQLDFSKISQIEFAPWSGSKDATGVMYLDNLRLTKEKP